jgi:acetate kinase
VAVLVLNGGSSSWKTALYHGVASDAVPRDAATLEPDAAVALAWRGGTEPARLDASRRDGRAFSRDVHVERGAAAVPVLLDGYRELGSATAGVAAVGHRIVHGGGYFSASVRIDDDVVARLRALEPFAPSHNPLELAGIEAIARALPHVTQVASFDTAFHRTLPPRAYVYGGPYEWLARDVRRYGFHGINVAYCLERAGWLLGRATAALRCVVAHLGGGCSVTAVRDGQSVDTSMGFTPLDGLVMGTRSGAIDPGILVYLLRDAPGQTAKDAADRIDDVLNRKSGLLGLSGVSSDVRNVLEAAADGDARADLALDVFSYRIATTIAATLPALERIDALVFTGGIGEHAAAVRRRVCEQLAFAGIALDARQNESRTGQEDVDVALADLATRVLVVTAREEWYVARECARLLASA